MPPTLKELEQIVISAARTELLPRFNEVSHSRKSDGSILTEADLAMQNHVQQALEQRWPEYVLLGEEMEETRQLQLLTGEHEGLWCLDPLDGTSNFAVGIPLFAASLALIVKGEVVMGLVYDPVRNECFTAQKGVGAWLNGEPLKQQTVVPSLAQSIGIIDFKRLPSELARRLAGERPYSSQRSFGSVALDWCWIAAGSGHIYLHGKQKLWDYVAGVLILDEAGGHSVTLEGEPVYRPTLQGRSAVAALDKRLFQAWVNWLKIEESAENSISGISSTSK